MGFFDLLGKELGGAVGGPVRGEGDFWKMNRGGRRAEFLRKGADFVPSAIVVSVEEEFWVEAEGELAVVVEVADGRALGEGGILGGF